MKLTVIIDSEEINLEEIVKNSRSNIIELGGLVLEAETRKASPVDTGRLQGSWVNNTSDDFVQLSTSVIYARYLDEGTGLFGPHKALIYPKKGKYLVFKSGNELVFARYTKGIEGRHYVDKAIRNFEAKLPSIITQAIQKSVGE
jgi:hypothetical protein